MSHRCELLASVCYELKGFAVMALRRMRLLVYYLLVGRSRSNWLRGKTRRDIAVRATLADLETQLIFYAPPFQLRRYYYLYLLRVRRSGSIALKLKSMYSRY